MEILLAKSAGFCFGVDNAIRKTTSLLKTNKTNIFTLGELIHNKQVVDKLKSNGIESVDDITKLHEGDTIVIRAHGITSSMYDDLNKQNVIIEDATCPYVKKIHKLVAEKSSKGYLVAIVGDKNHPEVIGIRGWCNGESIVIYNKEDIENLVTDKPICIVAQTTITSSKWEDINNILKEKFKNIEKFDTICSATNTRQTEASNIAKVVDIMLIIGGKNSSNTQKLYDVCIKYCKETYKIETVEELPTININKIKKIGITAGASTPEWVIEEVIRKMDELNRNDEMSFEEAFESSLVSIHSGSIVKGRIIGHNYSEVFVDLGFKSDGIIPMSEFTDDPEFNAETDLKAGDEIEVFVVRVNDGEGNVLLSKRKIDAQRNFEKIEKLYNDKTSIKVKIIEVINNAGVIAYASGIRIFIHASQLDNKFVKDLHEYMNKTFMVRITEYNRQKNRIVGSRRILLEEEKEMKATEFWNEIELNKEYKGTVKSLTTFGAFVDIGGVDGMIHVSELSWSKIKHPSEVLKVGESVSVYILKFDKDNKKISLGFKRTEDNPWNVVFKKYKVGDVILGTVVRMMPFGVFVELKEGVDGLVHISQISNKRLAKPDEVLKIGQEVEAKIIEINEEQKKLGLSIKEVKAIDKDAPDEEKAEDLPTEYSENMSSTISDNVNNK